jgi:hypothetical protein
LVGEDGEALIQIWWSIANDPMRRDADRLRASELVAERGWGKAPTFAAMEEADPLGLEDAHEAAKEFRAKILRLAEAGELQTAPEGPTAHPRPKSSEPAAALVGSSVGAA